MNISGSGSMPGGIYDDSISISGSGCITGDVSCKDFSISGSGRVNGNVNANGSLRISGSGHVEGNVNSEEFLISGSGHIDGKVMVKGIASISGMTRCESLRTNEIQISGGCNIEGDLTAETARIKGNVHSDGLLNAEDIEILFYSESRFGSIGGSKITIDRNSVVPNKGLLKGLFHQSKDIHKGHLTVTESIEGDELNLSYVNAKEVSGRIVTIGPGCNIDELCYSESLDLSPDSYVGHIGGPDIM